MTCRERLIRVFQKKEIDRLPIRIWGVDPLFPSVRDDWKFFYDLVEKYQLEIIRDWSPKKEEFPPSPYEVITNQILSKSQDMISQETIIKTPKGNLTQISTHPKDGSPGMVTKYFIEDIKDAEKWLSLPDEGFPKIDSYWELEEKTGQRAMIMIGIDEAMYMVQRMMGSELFGYWLYDERELLREMVDKAYRKIENLVKHYLSYNIGDAYGWVGPELCIPPLASIKDFQEFVFNYDKKIIDLIHNSKKLTWIHCHGDMKPVIEEFIKMGLDCLNPIEPPPVSKITLKDALKICKGKMALDGGIEDGAFLTLKQEKMKGLVEETISQVEPGSSFILCPTSTPNTVRELLPYQIENYKIYVETAVKLRNWYS